MTTSDGYVLKMERMPRRSAPFSVPSLPCHRHHCCWCRSLHLVVDDPRQSQGCLLLLPFQGLQLSDGRSTRSSTHSATDC